MPRDRRLDRLPDDVRRSERRLVRGHRLEPGSQRHRPLREQPPGAFPFCPFSPDVLTDHSFCANRSTPPAPTSTSARSSASRPSPSPTRRLLQSPRPRRPPTLRARAHTRTLSGATRSRADSASSHCRCSLAPSRSLALDPLSSTRNGHRTTHPRAAPAQLGPIPPSSLAIKRTVNPFLCLLASTTHPFAFLYSAPLLWTQSGPTSSRTP